MQLNNINQELTTLTNTMSASKDLPTVEQMELTPIDKKGNDAKISDCDQTDVTMKE